LQQSITEKIVRNTIFNAVGRFWTILVLLLLTPYIIRHLGNDRFGIWALVSVLTGYFGLLDFGIGTSFTKYFAEYYTKKDHQKINQIISTGFVIYFILALLLITIMVLAMNPLLKLFNIPENMHGEASFVFLIGIILFGISNTLSPFKVLQTGLQRMDVTNKIAIILSFPNIIGTIIFLEMGYGLRGLMINNAILVILTGIITIIASYKIFPELRFGFSFFQKEMLKTLFNFGYKVEIAIVALIITSQTDKLFITALLSVSLVTYYQLGNSIVQAVLALATLFVSAITPAFAEIEAKGERQLLITAYIRMTKYLSFITIPSFIFILISASNIMAIWMGPGYAQAALIIQILSIGWMINKIAHVGSTVSQAIEQPQLMAKGALITIILTIILGITFIKIFGFAGVAWGTTIALIIGTFYFQYKLHSSLGIPIKTLVATTAPFLFMCIIATSAVIGIDFIIAALHISQFGIMGWISFAVRIIIFSTIYLLCVYYAKLFDAIDIDLFRQRIPLFNKLIKNI